MKRNACEYGFLRRTWFIGILFFFCSVIAQAQTLKSIKLETNARYGQVLKFHFSEPLQALPQHFKTNNPPQLILEFNDGISNINKSRLISSRGAFRKIEVLQKNGRLRVIISLNTEGNQKMEIRGPDLLVIPYATSEQDSFRKVRYPDRSPALREPPEEARDYAGVPARSAGLRSGRGSKGRGYREMHAHRYTGEPISLNFQDIKVRAVLQLLSQFTGINIVASDSIKSSITLHLHQVPWDEVLDLIIKTQGLAKKQMDNVILVAPIEEMMTRDKQELQANQEVSELSPIVSELIPVRYANAAEIATLLKGEKNSLLSPRGQLSTDVRTNTLWVQDTYEKIREVKRMLEKLDCPVKQVLIEARIVDITRNYERDLGIRFGVSKPPHLSGTLDGANLVASKQAKIGLVPVPERLNMDFPAAPVDGSRPVTIGVALANLGKGYLLDLELSALEEEGKGTVISSPRLVTTDQRTARIESGEEIPYQEATSSGATSVAFKKAVLSLEVTPHITPDNKLVMDLNIHQDTRGPALDNVPSILTKQIQTRVLVDNGETLVLGGIYESTDNKNIDRIPLIGSIPVLGNFFRNGQDINNRNELIIFITPKIVDGTVQEELIK